MSGGSRIRLEGPGITRREGGAHLTTISGGPRIGVGRVRTSVGLEVTLRVVRDPLWSQFTWQNNVMAETWEENVLPVSDEIPRENFEEVGGEKSAFWSLAQTLGNYRRKCSAFSENLGWISRQIILSEGQ